MRDPELLLKSYFSKDKIPKIKNNYILLEDKKFHLETKTNLVLNYNNNKFYSIIDIYLFLKHKKNNTVIKKYIEEMKEFRKKGLEVNFISPAHQNDIENYFFGKIEKIKDINENFNIELKKRENFVANEKFSEENLEVLKLTRQKEKINKTKNSILRNSKDYLFVINMLQSSGNNNNKIDIKEETKFNKKDQTILDYVLKEGGNVLEEGKPIIFLPNTFIKGNLNLGNIKDLLLNGKYFLDYDKFKSYNQRYYLEVPYKINNKMIFFEACDDINFIKSKRNINNVVAIFISGNEFQFKDSINKWNEINIAKLFKKIRAYYFAYEDEKIKPIVLSWNVKIWRISRNERHRDQIIKNEFWEDLINFINTKKIKN